MPYEISCDGDSCHVLNKTTGKRLSKKPMTKSAAEKYMRALYANVSDAAKKQHNGAMIALPIPLGIAEGLVELSRGVFGDLSTISRVPPEEMHITLVYLGSVDDLSLEMQMTIQQTVGAFVISWYDRCGGEPLSVEVHGAARFNNTGDDQSALVFLVNSPLIHELQRELEMTLEENGIISPSLHGFTPHITIGYYPSTDLIGASSFPNIPLFLSDISVCLGDSQTFHKFASTEAPPEEGTSLTVYKGFDGHYRWIITSSNGFEDRDRECVSVKALEEDCLRADQEAQSLEPSRKWEAYGPLTFWHQEDARFEREGDWTSVKATDDSWAIGKCDFNLVVNGMLIESGTFFDETIAEPLATISKSLRVSIAFAKPPGSPDRERVYRQIRRYARTLVPLGHAVPSNRFTSVNIEGVS